MMDSRNVFNWFRSENLLFKDVDLCEKYNDKFLPLK